MIHEDFCDACGVCKRLILDLISENDALVEALEKIEGGEGCYTPSYGDCCNMGCARVAREAISDAKAARRRTRT